MTSTQSLALFCGALILFMLLVAVLGNRNVRLQQLAQTRPIIILSLCICTSGVAMYSAFLYAATITNGLFSIFFGVGLVFLTSRTLLLPTFRLVRKYQFQNLIDILAFRFKHSSVGPVASLLVTLTMIPLLAAQLSSLTLIFVEAANINADNAAKLSNHQVSAAIVLPVLLSIYILQNHRIERRERNHSLVLIAAIDSLLRFAAIYILGFAALRVFGDLGAFQDWMATNAHHYKVSTEISTNSRSLLIAAFITTFCLPHVFHIAMVEKPNKSSGDTATWAVPLLLIVFCLPFTVIIAVMSIIDDNPQSHDYLIKLATITKDSTLSVWILLAVLSGFFTSALIIIGSCANHLVNYLALPLNKQSYNNPQLHKWLRRSRRRYSLIIVLLIWLIANQLSGDNALFKVTDLSLLLLMQLFPGLVCSLYYPKVSSEGFIAGLVAGGLAVISFIVFGEYLCSDCQTIFSGMQNDVVPISLGINTATLFLVSYLHPISEREFTNAKAMINISQFKASRKTKTYAVRDFITALVPIVGHQEAEKQVAMAMEELNIDAKESRPYVLIQLHDVVEKNLGKSLGSAVAQKAIVQLMPYSLSRMQNIDISNPQAMDDNTGVTGIASELDRMRRFHRNTLARLPVGVCYINAKQEILLWNESLSVISQLAPQQAEGKYLTQLPKQWSTCLIDFIKSKDITRRLSIEVTEQQRWIRLYKEESKTQSQLESQGDNVLVIEDITDIKTLEDELMHSERLASIGRLAAGVAHEIGNPVTGIACLAQNLKLDSEEPEVLGTAQEIITQTHRISSIMQSLVSFSHAGGAEIEHHRTECNISDCIKDAMSLLKLDRMATPVDYEFGGEAEALVYGDPQRLQQVFVNLLSNARDASEAGDCIHCYVLQRNGITRVSVTDQGSGIAAANIEKIFEPFFTTKSVGKGTGLGLALVFGIIEEHEGSIKVISPVAEGRGTRFIIELPMLNASQRYLT